MHHIQSPCLVSLSLLVQKMTFVLLSHIVQKMSFIVSELQKNVSFCILKPAVKSTVFVGFETSLYSLYRLLFLGPMDTGERHR